MRSFGAMRIHHFLPLLLPMACTPGFRKADDAAIRAVMAAQEQAWDNGDIPGFMQGYADTICFIGRRGTTCGREAVEANYLRNYPDRMTMGDLSFDIGELLAAGPDRAWMTGSWTLYRAADTLGGGFTLLWARGPDGWRIVRDHTY